MFQKSELNVKNLVSEHSILSVFCPIRLLAQDPDKIILETVPNIILFKRSAYSPEDREGKEVRKKPGLLAITGLYLE